MVGMKKSAVCLLRDDNEKFYYIVSLQCYFFEWVFGTTVGNNIW